MNIRTLQKRAGPHGGGENFGDGAAKVHLHLSQALSCHRPGMNHETGITRIYGNHTIGVPVCLTDALLTLAGICQAHGMELEDGIRDALGPAAENDCHWTSGRRDLDTLGRLAHRRLEPEERTESFGDLMASCHAAVSQAVLTSRMRGMMDPQRWLANPYVHRPGVLTDLGTAALWVLAAAHRCGIRLEEPVRARLEFDQGVPKR